MPPSLPRLPSHQRRPAHSSWTRPPEARAVAFDQPTLRWIDWLCACSLPLPHVAAILAVDLAALDRWVNRTTRQGPPRRTPIGPERKGTRPPAVLGQNATKLRRMRELGYTAPAIARMLDLELDVVTDFIARLAPIRRAALVRVREPAAHARMRTPRCRRPRPEPRPPADWRDRDDDGPDGRPLILAAAELPALVVEVAHRAELEPPAEREEWSGPTSPHATKDRKRKLTADQIAEIRRERAAGASMYALARKYGCQRNTIYAALNREA